VSRGVGEGVGSTASSDQKFSVGGESKYVVGYQSVFVVSKFESLDPLPSVPDVR